jgi:hypothetical protein
MLWNILINSDDDDDKFDALFIHIVERTESNFNPFQEI